MPSKKRTLEDCFSSQDSKRSTTSLQISPQDPITDNDWVTKLYIDDRSPPPKKSLCIKEWNLGFGFIISVILEISDFINLTLLETILPADILKPSSEQKLATSTITEYLDVLHDEMP
ncbi:hypothetical protein JTE90_015455 [Oedothorax gibbosus]|uniref:Uncharacterized protein n=1 Tax=Oedothorax gibbosus TaxID=931172 RepID=A0AAV6UA94_9ARAC|nr:hypothetical protein JTE90_015455 [Oedothorax gibbosus]